MRHRVAGIVVVAGLGLTACGGSGVAAQIAEDLEASTGGAISGADARCAADAIVDALGTDQAQTFFDASQGDMDAAVAMADIDQEQMMEMGQAVAACDVDAPF